MGAIIYESHIHNKLVQFYLDKDCMTVYHGRWDVYFIQKGLMDEYFYMFMKTDDQCKRMEDKAKLEANTLKSSPLGKALSEQ